MRDDDFGEQMEDTMRQTALANAGGLLTGALAALGVGWYAYTFFQADLGAWAVAVGIVLGIIAGYVVGSIVALLLAAVAFRGFFQ